MKTKTIIFDFDGTLADSIDCFIQITKELSKKYKFDGLEQASKDLFKTHSIVDIALNFCHIPLYKLPFIVKDFKKKLVQNASNTKFFDEIIDILLELKNRGYRLGLLSSSPQKAIEVVILKYKIDNIFDFVMCDVAPFGKERNLKTLLKRYNLDKNNVFYVADEVRDIKACNKIDLKCIAVAWGFSDKNILLQHKPLTLVDKPLDLLDYFK